MIRYEVNLEMSPAVQLEFMRWLKTHVQEMLSFDGFLTASIFEEVEKPSSNIHIIVQYDLVSLEALQNYFTHHAPRMRQATIDNFANQVTATRRIYTRKESLTRVPDAACYAPHE